MLMISKLLPLLNKFKDKLEIRIATKLLIALPIPAYNFGLLV